MRAVDPSNVAATCVQVFSASGETAGVSMSLAMPSVSEGRGRLPFAYNPYDAVVVVGLRTALCHPLSAVGLSHASTVSPVVRSRELASLTVTRSLTPSTERACPYFPAVHVAPEMVPVLPLPEISATDVPLPSLKPYAATSPPSGATETVLPADGISTLPLSSTARLRNVVCRVCGLSAAGVHTYDQLVLPVAVRHVRPSSTDTSTPLTTPPPVSLAVPVIVTGVPL